VPADVKLKDPKDFILIGRPATRTDAPAKSNGSAIFTQDVKLPGMLTAVVLHPPRFGAKLKGFDAAAAKQVKGVEQVVPFSTPVTNGVAVLARDYWSAKKGRDALVADWDESAAFRLGTPEIMAKYKRLATTPGSSARKDGDVDAALKGAAKVLEAAYFPYLAHASGTHKRVVTTRRLRDLERRAVPDRRPGSGREASGSGAPAGQDQPALRRGQLRTARQPQIRFRARGRRDRQG
jgi:isoquinoline 1-oxidoreductase beta subunit